MPSSIIGDIRNSPTRPDRPSCRWRNGCLAGSVAVADSSYAVIDLLNAVQAADLNGTTSPRRRRATPRHRIPPTNVAARLADPKTSWRRLKVTGSKQERSSMIWHLVQLGCQVIIEPMRLMMRSQIQL